jgi:hypothetical protein
MRYIRLVGWVIGILLLASIVSADDVVISVAQVELGISSPYTISSPSADELSVQLGSDPTTLTIKASATEDIYPTTVAEIMNASRIEPLEYNKLSLNGIPALVGDNLEDEEADHFAHVLVIWQGILYEFTLSPLADGNPFIEDIGTAWDRVIESLVFVPNVDSPVFTIFETTTDEITSLPLELPVKWELANRPDNSNLEFIQILSDGQVINVELPRSDPFIAASGEGLVNISTIDEEGFIDLQVRLFDLTNERILAVRQIIVPIDTDSITVPTALTTSDSGIITQFDSDVDLIEQTTTVTWRLNAEAVEEVRYQAIGAEGEAVIEFLPTQISGTYQFSGTFEQSDATNIATLAVSISGTQSVSSTNINYSGESDQPQITVLELTDSGTQVNALPAQASVTWEVINRPPNTNLEFVQVLPNNTFINAELPRPEPIIASTGSGMVNLVASDTFDLTLAIGLVVRVRLIDEDGNILTSRDVTIPYIPQ